MSRWIERTMGVAVICSQASASDPVELLYEITGVNALTVAQDFAQTMGWGELEPRSIEVSTLEALA